MYSASKIHAQTTIRCLPDISFCKLSSLSIHRILEERAQATIEAAFAIPILMILILMLLQPGIILYDKVVMNDAAAEGCRVLVTSSNADSICEDYIRRRLSAIPEADIFHIHSRGCSWNIQMNGNETSEQVQVSITTEVQPLPLVGTISRILGIANGNGNLTITSVVEIPTQPDWCAGQESPSNWIGSWE